MKKLLFVLAFPIYLFAQDPESTPIKVRHDDISCDIPSLNGAITYVFKDSIPGQSKDQLFISAKTWVSSNFKEVKDIIQIEDKESGLLVTK